MKKCVLFILSLFVVVPASGQESGNRIYGNSGYYQQKRQMLANTGMLGNSNEGYAIEARVLTNLKPDAFVVVFGVNDEGSNAASSNEKVNTKIGNLIQRIKPLGIDSSNVFIDFITQNRVYDFTVSGTQATENLTGFETKKTVAIRYKDRGLFERIVSAADGPILDLLANAVSGQEIFVELTSFEFGCLLGVRQLVGALVFQSGDKSPHSKEMLWRDV